MGASQLSTASLICRGTLAGRGRATLYGQRPSLIGQYSWIRPFHIRALTRPPVSPSGFDPAVTSLMRLDAGSRFILYPDAGEGGGSFQPSVRRTPGFVPAGSAADDERSAEEAGRRPRANLRRYRAAVRLNRLGPLTYRSEGCHDPVVVRAHLADFFRALRVQLGGSSVCPPLRCRFYLRIPAHRIVAGRLD